MPVGPGPRFFIEAVFIVAVAAIAAISKLSTLGIILSIGAAWALVAAVEWTASRQGARPAPAGDAPVPAEQQKRPPLVQRLRERPHRAALPPAPEPVPLVEESHVRVLPTEKPPAPPEPEPAPAAMPVQAEPERGDARPLAEPVEAAAAPEPEPPAPVPAAELLEPAPAAVQESGVPPEPPVAPEPEPEPVAPPTPVLASAPPPGEPAPASAPRPVPQRDVISLAARGGPVEWNLWDLERLTREHSGQDAFKDEERSYLLIYLREFASADGVLPVDFDGLVRDSFGELVGAG
jgi:hypothetical protein